MTMTIIWTGIVLVSLLCGLATGRGPEVASAAVEGAAAGCEAPFDILPAVWLASALSVGVGILACKIFSRVWRD